MMISYLPSILIRSNKPNDKDQITYKNISVFNYFKTNFMMKG